LTDRRYFWPVYAGLLSLVAALCFGALRTHLLDTHDAETFRDHERIAADLALFFSPHKEQASGRPFAEAVKYTAYLIWGNDVAAFHLLVVFFHLLAAFLLARLVASQGGSAALAGLTGLLFLVNVTHFQAVHWISALDYPLALCCGLAALLMLGRSAKLAFAGLLALGAMAHLSIAVVWALALYGLWRRQDALVPALRVLWPSGLLLVAAFSLSLQLAADNTSTWSSANEYAAQSVLDLVLGMLRVLAWFSSRLLTTAHWLILPIYLRQTWELILGAVLAGLLLWLVWRREEPLATAALATLLGLLPYLLLTEATILGLPAGPSRYLYQASAGSSLLLAWCLGWIGRRTSPYLAGALVALVLLSSYYYLRQVEAISLYTSARSYSANKDFSNARKQFYRALSQGPKVLPLEDVYARLCLLLMDSDEEYLPLLGEALEAHPNSERLRLFQLATAAINPSAEFREQAMKLALDLRYTAPHDATITAKALHNLGAGFLKKRKPETAIRAFEQTLRLEPERFKTLKDLTFAHWQLAAQLADRIAEADLDHRAALVARFRQQISAALNTSRQALKLRPDADLYYQLGKAYQQRERYSEALTAYGQCLEQDSSYRRAYQRMAEVYARLGQKAEVARALQAAAHLSP
jgi:tetratricopeptide (TPR) repeat protein